MIFMNQFPLFELSQHCFLEAFTNYKSRVEELEQLLEEKNEAPPVQSRSNLPPSARRQIASAQSRRK